MVVLMKKIMLLAGCVLLFAACSKEDLDAFGDTLDAGNNPVRDYMVLLTDQLGSASLEELEEALNLESIGSVMTLFYAAEGGLTEPGSVWKLNRTGRLKGLVMKKLQEEGSWQLEYDGDLELDIYTYPTHFTMTAVRPEAKPHGDWTVTLEGSRTEKDGYACNFSTDGELRFEALQEDNLWYAYGTLQMQVFKDETLIDNAFLSLRGARKAATFAHGL